MPELKHKLDLMNKELWKKFIRFRGFLEESALEDGNLACSDIQFLSGVPIKIRSYRPGTTSSGGV